MSDEELFCWKCGEPLVDVLQPFSRLSKCKQCNADLHVCLMCEFYDTSKSNSCNEPIAEKVTDKKRSNFCGYFKPNPKVRGKQGKPQEAVSELNALFDINSGSAGNESVSEEEASKQKLDELFGLDEKKDK